MLKKEETPWSEGVVMICTKCAKAISPAQLSEEGNAGENLKMFLKKSLKESGDLSKVRILTTSCLDICVDEFQAVTYASTHGKTESFILNPEQDRQALLQLIKDKAHGK